MMSQEEMQNRLILLERTVRQLQEARIPAVERFVSQEQTELEQHIRELLARIREFEERMTKQLDTIVDDQIDMRERFHALEQRLYALEAEMRTIQERLTRIES